MDVGSIAAAFVAMQAGQLQEAAAAKMLRINANASADAAKPLDAASQNVNILANVASGIGSNRNITA